MSVNAISGECMLLAWSESHSRGATITLLLSDPDELAPFKRLTVAKGKIAGQRLMYAFAEIGDDEKLVSQPTLKRLNETAPEEKGGKLARLAGTLCAKPDFQAWCGVDCEADAAQVIRNLCCVSSRAQLDHNAVAERLFHELVRVPFLDRDK